MRDSAEEYLRRLGCELEAVGVTGSARRRLLAEAGSHLADAAAASGVDVAVRAFGPARELAELVAAELAVARSRRAATGTFAALAPAGALYAVLFTTLPLASLDLFGGRIPGVGALALAGIVLFPQLAFVAGVLALLRVLRPGADRAQSREELRVQRWRTGVALAAGALTLLSLAVTAVVFWHDVPRWWRVAALAAPALAVPLAVCAWECARAARPATPAGSRCGDVRDDLRAAIAVVPGVRTLWLPAEPWQLLVLVAGGAAFCSALAGVVAGDPFDGLLRAAFEASAVVVCFLALGRRLALR